ncbi:MAG: RNA polymerase sigma factor [Sediminibacterium sp.]|nr:RNA polymerase sigma factor [Sediminibacterium sp.]MDP3127204.1 RNA polymerase sigma factor [Sediminibacterium sp.]
MDDHQKLVKDCLRKNIIAQKQLYDLFSPIMLGICYRYTKSMNDAEEVLQLGFIKVFVNLHQYKMQADLGAWIRRIMVNTAINYLKRKPQYQLDLSFEENNLHPVVIPDADIRLNEKDLLNMVRQLPPGFQTIFNLHAVEGCTHIEIGKMLGINEGTSRSQYARARALLIKWLEVHSVNDKKDSYGR